MISRMAAGQFKAPPIFSEEDDYLSWKNDINIWQSLLTWIKNKQGPATYLAMTGRTTKAVWEITAPKIGGGDGLGKII